MHPGVPGSAGDRRPRIHTKMAILVTVMIAREGTVWVGQNRGVKYLRIDSSNRNAPKRALRAYISPPAHGSSSTPSSRTGVAVGSMYT